MRINDGLKMDLLILFVHSTVVYPCKGNMTPQFVESRIKDINFTSKKLWIEYIKKFTSFHVKLIVYSKANMQKLLLMLNNKARRFTMIMIRFQTEELVIAASGQIHQMSYRLYSKDYDFYVNQNVKMNLTFITINFNSPLANCTTAQNSVSILLRSKFTKVYSYCGFYSLFYSYPNVNNFTIFITKNLLEFFEVHLLFLVMDSNLIYTISGSNIVYNLHAATQVLSYHNAIIKEKFCLNSYLIVVSKMYRIILKTSTFRQGEFVIFDGPGFTYSIIENNNDRYITRFFTCVLLFLNHKREHEGIIEYTVINVEILQFSKVKNQNIDYRFPNKQCNNILCLVLIQADQGYQVNITVSHIFGAGKYKFYCHSGGLLTIELLDNNYSESVVLCEDHSSEFAQSRSFYSSNSSLILMQYWFGEQNTMRSLVSFAQTKCQPVHMHPCSYISAYCQSIIQGEKYLDDITKHTGLDLWQNDMTATSFSKREILFDLYDIECSIIQIGNRYTPYIDLMSTFRCFYRGYCHFSFSPKRKEVAISDVRGYLSSKQISLLQFKVHLTTPKNIIKLPFVSINELGFIFKEHFHSVKVFFNYFKGRKKSWLDITLSKYNWLPKTIMLIGSLQSKNPKIMNIMDFGSVLYSPADLNLRIDTKCYPCLKQAFIQIYTKKIYPMVFGRKYILHG